MIPGATASKSSAGPAPRLRLTARSAIFICRGSSLGAKALRATARHRTSFVLSAILMARPTRAGGRYGARAPSARARGSLGPTPSMSLSAVIIEGCGIRPARAMSTSLRVAGSRMPWTVASASRAPRGPRCGATATRTRARNETARICRAMTRASSSRPSAASPDARSASDPSARTSRHSASKARLRSSAGSAAVMRPTARARAALGGNARTAARHSRAADAERWLPTELTTASAVASSARTPSIRKDASARLVGSRSPIAARACALWVGS